MTDIAGTQSKIKIRLLKVRYYLQLVSSICLLFFIILLIFSLSLTPASVEMNYYVVVDLDIKENTNIRCNLKIPLQT